MKPKVKKELEHNKLADMVANAIQAVRPYANYILAAVVVLLGVYLFARFQSSQARGEAQAAWTSLYAGFEKAGSQASAEPLSKVADDFRGSRAAGLAMAQAGRLLCNQAGDKFYSNPKEAMILLQKAEDHFKRVLERFDADENAEAARTALSGLAYVYESRGDLSAAAKQLRQVIDDYPGTAVAAIAAERLKALAEPDAAAFYAAAATQAKAAATQAALSEAGE